jgi:hypothetical protein
MNAIPFFVLIVLLLAGCAAAPETPTAPNVVRVPVPFKDPEPKKRELPKKPRFVVDDLPLGAALHDQARMCFAEREQRKAYEIELEGACR